MVKPGATVCLYADTVKLSFKTLLIHRTLTKHSGKMTYLSPMAISHLASNLALISATKLQHKVQVKMCKKLHVYIFFYFQIIELLLSRSLPIPDVLSLTCLMKYRGKIRYLSILQKLHKQQTCTLRLSAVNSNRPQQYRRQWGT
jgi:hypothetical protein